MACHLQALLILFEEGKVIDPITISEKIKEIGAVESFGGITSIMDLTYGLPHFSSITEYVAIVREKAIARAFIKQANLAISEVLSEECSALDVIEKHEQQLYELKRDSVHTSSVLIGEIVEGEVLKMVKLAQQATSNTLLGLSTGFRNLNQMTAGLLKTDLIIVAGRSSMGKTSLALSMSLNATDDDREAVVANFSLEMSREQVTNRFICQTARVDSSRYRLGHLTKEEWVRVSDAASRLKEKNIVIDDSPSLTSLQLKSKCLEIANKHKRLDLVVVDYLQLMSGTNIRESREREVAKISRDLKRLAKELQVPVIAVSQLSRAPETRADKRPILSDLRESGGIENDADVVILLFREEYYKKTEENQGVAEAIVAKNRNGAVGSAKLAFLDEYATFEELYKQ
jgi:replicative DNA helicase